MSRAFNVFALLVRGVSLLVLMGALAWIGGFLWFTVYALSPSAPTPTADGIVALTGGAGRIQSSLDLLQQGKGRMLLISGVAPRTSLAELLYSLNYPLPDQLKDRVFLGYQAVSTVGNAREAAEWIDKNHIRSLIIVTAGYHMWRALREMRHIRPDIPLYPYVVIPPLLAHPFRLAALRTLSTEYNKFLLAEVGLTHSFYVQKIAGRKSSAHAPLGDMR